MARDSDRTNPMDTSVQRARPTGRQVILAIATAALLVFIFTNWETTTVNLFTATVEMPLWLVLGITAIIGFALGTFTASRRAKARLPQK